MAEGGGLLNRCTSLNLYRGFESRTLRVLRLTQTFLWKDLGNVGCSYRLVRSTRLERVAPLRITMIIIPPNLSYLSQNLFRLAVFFMDSILSAAGATRSGENEVHHQYSEYPKLSATITKPQQGEVAEWLKAHAWKACLG